MLTSSQTAFSARILEKWVQVRFTRLALAQPQACFPTRSTRSFSTNPSVHSSGIPALRRPSM
jgi:hypothetical protein